MPFKPFIFPLCANAEASLTHVRELSENCMIRPPLRHLCCRPFRELVLTPIPAATRIITWHPDLKSEVGSLTSDLRPLDSALNPQPATFNPS